MSTASTSKCYLCTKEGKNKCFDIFTLDAGCVCDTCPFTQSRLTVKNSLQEWCQKNKKELPQYESKRIGGTPNEPQWESMVTVCGKSYSARGEMSTKKVDVEMLAAAKALRKIYTESLTQKITIKTDKKVHILIDIENLQSAVDDLFSRFELPNENVSVHVFYSKNVKPAMIEGVTYHLAESFHRDAADTLLLLIVGGLLVMGGDAKIIVITKDHFGAALSEIFTTKHRDISVYNDVNKIVI